MKQIFFIFGYGVPKNIQTDDNYRRYLSIAFNRIYDLTTATLITDPLIICSGGKTDMFKPYKRSEAGEMVRVLKQLANRRELKTVTKRWNIMAEDRSLSTLENLINCKTILTRKKIKRGAVTIFCEHTRKPRIQTVAKKILGNAYDVTVIPIDFDLSSNRYLDPAFLKEKEATELRHSLWALKSATNLKKHHALFQEKIDYLRAQGSKAHADSVRTWWQKKLRDIEQLSSKK